MVGVGPWVMVWVRVCGSGCGSLVQGVGQGVGHWFRVLVRVSVTGSGCGSLVQRVGQGVGVFEGTRDEADVISEFESYIGPFGQLSLCVFRVKQAGARVCCCGIWWKPGGLKEAVLHRLVQTTSDVMRASTCSLCEPGNSGGPTTSIQALCPRIQAALISLRHCSIIAPLPTLCGSSMWAQMASN